MIRYADNNIVSCPGDRVHILYAPKVADDGTIELIEAGKEDLVEKIGSFAESTDIHLIMQRVAQGDLSGLNQNPGLYGDFTTVPKTYAEFLQLQIDSNNLFMKLPQDVRDKFGNDANQFMAQSGTDDWRKKLGDVLPPEYRYKEETVTEEVKSE